MAFLVLLEALSPVERAVFMLREVFAYGYPDVARITGKTEVNCRQIFARASVPAPARRAEGEELARRFFEAAAGGDMDALLGMLAPDVVLHADGGGKTQAIGKPLAGRQNVTRMLVSLLRRARNMGASIRLAWVNGRPGAVLYDAEGRVVSVMELDIVAERRWRRRDPDDARRGQPRQARPSRAGVRRGAPARGGQWPVAVRCATVPVTAPGSCVTQPCRSMSAQATSAPPSAITSLNCLPRPLPAPVTNATLPSSALATNVHRVGHAALGFGRPQRCWRSLADAGAFAALGGQHVGVAGVGVAPAQVSLEPAGQRRVVRMV